MITMSGNLTGDTILTSGTYYFVTDCNIDGYNLDFDLSSGNIFCKFESGDKSIIANVSGVIQTINTGSYKLYFTSSHDDAHGEIAPTSSGVPAAGDQSSPYITTTIKPYDLNLDGCEIWYWGNNTKSAICWGDQPLPGSVFSNATLNNISLKNCSIFSSGSNNTCFIGFYAKTGFGTLEIENLTIDDTNSIDSSNTNCYAMRFPRPASWTMRNASIYPTGSCYALLSFKSSTSGTHSCNWDNLYLKYPGSGPAGTVVLHTITTAGGNATININNLLIDGANKSCSGLGISVAGDAPITLSLYNSLIVRCNMGIDRHLDTPTLTMYEAHNRFYDNNGNSDEALGPRDLVADPEFQNVPSGVIVDSDNIFPTGYFIGNLDDYEEMGSDSHGNLDIDTTIYSATGYQYNNINRVTPGIYYKVNTLLPRTFTSKRKSINPIFRWFHNI